MSLLSETFYRVFDPVPYGFPVPSVPVLPKRLGKSLACSRSHAYEPITSGARAVFYSRARYALFEALRRLAVGPGAVVLVPSYHCRNMLDPVLALGADALLYPVGADLHANPATIESAVAACTLPVRALLVVHYFGFPRQIAALQAWCAARDIALIEDCSHAYYRPIENSGLGRAGRYVIASPYKFCPSVEGGVLILPNQETPPSLAGRTLKETLQIGMGIVRGACSSGAEVLELPGRYAPVVLDPHDPYSEPPATISPTYAGRLEKRRGSRLSRWVAAVSSADRIAQARRKHYLHWLEQTRKLPRASALFPELREGVVPYMFPLLLKYPMPDFFRLKRAGVPVWRWDNMAVSGCETSMAYRLGLIHLPCHQDLSEREMTWMTAVIGRVLGAAEADL
ncbi:MAG: DegT/DnrJ/EryC1/StrS aminotransferase family protein [Rhodocyclaceae bacterium]|nr:DegT/DnrJ/EryC1/StrS aminotransferase family protein [Rhodocyclaceae bacterium]MBX3669007.1 DegT/DnrJ/EryC1/StrS aminotransferase family protein [Rhodocyclaceae bacterium]